MTRRKYGETATTIMSWVAEYDSVQVWLSKLNGAKEKRALSLWYYCDWAGKSPAELLMLKPNFENLDAERLLDKFVICTSYPESLKWKSVLAVRSFYRCNYRELQREAGKMEYYQSRPQRNPSKRKRLELYQACFNPRDRALICITMCSAIALETLSHLLWSHFEEGWQAQEIPHISIPSELLKGHGKGKYRGVRQETFVTPECKRELLRYRSYMTKRHGVLWQDDMHVFLGIKEPYAPLRYQAVGNAVFRASQIAHVGFGSHDGRRIVETALENVGTPRNWIQKVKGRKVRGEDAPYSKPAVEQLRVKYCEALPELEFMEQPSDASRGLSSEQVQMFEALAKVLDRYPEKVEKFERFLMDL